MTFLYEIKHHICLKKQSIHTYIKYHPMSSSLKLLSANVLHLHDYIAYLNNFSTTHQTMFDMNMKTSNVDLRYTQICTVSK